MKMQMALRGMICILLMGALPGAARGDGPRHAISMEVSSLSTAGVSAQYENFMVPDSWSFAGTLGVRGAARDDYGSVTLSAGAEARYWIRGRAFRSRLRQAMIGPFVGAGVDMAHTSTSMDGHNIGSAITITEMLSVGYRFAAWSKVEITPYAGIGVRTEIDGSGRLPASTRGTASLGLTAGWMF